MHMQGAYNRFGRQTMTSYRLVDKLLDRKRIILLENVYFVNKKVHSLRLVYFIRNLSSNVNLERRTDLTKKNFIKSLFLLK